MRRCAVRTVALVAEADLPILPFLAPRVFQPWPLLRPSPSCRTLHTGSRRSVTARDALPCQGPGVAVGQGQGQGQGQRNCFSSVAHSQADLKQTKRIPRNKGDESARSSNPSLRPREAIRRSDPRAPDPSGHRRRGNGGRRWRGVARQPGQSAVRQSETTPASIVKSRWTANQRSAESSARTKWVSVGHPVRRRSKSSSKNEVLGYDIDEEFLIWNHHFARLNNRYDARVDSRPSEKTAPVLNPEAPRWAKQMLDTRTPNPKLDGLLGRAWRRKWIHAMLFALSDSVQDAVRLLETTHVQPYLPTSWIDDSLSCVTRHYSKAGTTDGQRDHLVHVFCFLMERPGSSPLRLTGSSLRRLLAMCDREQILRLYESIVVNGVQLHWNTRLHFATALAHQGYHDQALDSLLDAVTDGADVTAPQFESNCATILRKAADQPDGLRVGLRMVQNLADIGVKLNLQLCNIVMLSAVEADDLKTAFSIYHSLVGHNLSADKYTHAILIKGCKSAIQDSDTLNTTIRQAIADVDILKSPVVATEIIHCLYLHHFAKDPAHAFSIITEAYTQLFDTHSLVSLGVLPAQCANLASERMQPTAPVQSIMMTAFMRQTLASPHRDKNSHLTHIYQRWFSLVQEGRRPYAKLAQTDHVFNTFLLAFIDQQSTLAQAAKVIRDMQTPMPVPPGVDPAHFNTRPCLPTVQTWSIFLHGFSRHGKIDLAEQVLTYMRERGMRPNQVTWNSLIGGYARIGDAEGAVAAFKRMRDEGFRVNEVTERALSKIRLHHVNA